MVSATISMSQCGVAEDDMIIPIKLELFPYDTIASHLLDLVESAEINSNAGTAQMTIEPQLMIRNSTMKKGKRK